MREDRGNCNVRSVTSHMNQNENKCNKKIVQNFLKERHKRSFVHFVTIGIDIGDDFSQQMILLIFVWWHRRRRPDKPDAHWSKLTS